ncbi:MAG: hypothetical protein ABI601_01935 [bacterium]
MTAPASTSHAVPPQLELRDADRLVGWIDGDIVRFRGFGSKRGASHAGAVAHQAMLRRLARGSRGLASDMEANLGSVRRKTDHANARANGRPVASVLRSFLDGIGGGNTGDFAVEIRVPPPVGELRMRGMAYVMYRALRSSGVAWPLLRPATAPEAHTAMATRAAAETNESTKGITSGGSHVIQRLLGSASRAWALPWARAHRVG